LREREREIDLIYTVKTPYSLSIHLYSHMFTTESF